MTHFDHMTEYFIEIKLEIMNVEYSVTNHNVSHMIT